MKTIAFIIALGLVSCAALEGASPKDANDALTQAHNACQLGRALTADDDRVREACDKLKAASDAARDAAKAVLDAVPEVK